LVSAAGLVPALALAQRAGLTDLAGQQLTVPDGPGCAAGAKVSALVAGMVAGADSIEDMDLLRHGAMDRLFAGAPGAVDAGHVLRALRFGHVRQLDAVAARFLAGLARHSPLIAPGAAVTYLDVDDTLRATYEGPQRAAGHRVVGRGGAGDRGQQAAQGLGEPRPRRGPAGR
jgi:hypothetical protein